MRIQKNFIFKIHSSQGDKKIYFLKIVLKMSLVKLPAFTIQYYEYAKKIDFAVEMFQIPLKIDGLFSPLVSNRFSLGYLNNFRRKQDSFECLLNLGLGVEFDKTDNDIYYIKNLSQHNVFLLMKNSEEQYQVEPGKFHLILKKLNQSNFLKVCVYRYLIYNH